MLVSVGTVIHWAKGWNPPPNIFCCFVFFFCACVTCYHDVTYFITSNVFYYTNKFYSGTEKVCMFTTHKRYFFGTEHLEIEWAKKVKNSSHPSHMGYFLGLITLGGKKICPFDFQMLGGKKNTRKTAKTKIMLHKNSSFSEIWKAFPVKFALLQMFCSIDSK